MVPAGPSPSLGRQTAAVSCQSSRPSRRDSPWPCRWGGPGELAVLADLPPFFPACPPKAQGSWVSSFPSRIPVLESHLAGVKEEGGCGQG